MPVPGITLAGTNQALDNSLNTVISEFATLRDETGVVRDCADMATLKEHTGTAFLKVNYGRVLMQSVSDGAETAAQVLSDALTAYTPGEVEGKVILAGSTIRRSADVSLEKNTAMILNNAYDLKEDADGCAQFASFTTSALGGTAVCSPGYGAAAASGLHVGNNTAFPEPAPKPWFWVIHPQSAVPLFGRLVPYALTPGGASTSYGATGGVHVGTTRGVGGGDEPGSIGYDVITKGIEQIGYTLAGMDVRMDANITVTSSNATGAAFSRKGLLYVSEVEPQPYVDEILSKALRGAKVYGMWGSYAWGVWRAAAYGIPTTFDASLATS